MHAHITNPDPLNLTHYNSEHLLKDDLLLQYKEYIVLVD